VERDGFCRSPEFCKSDVMELVNVEWVRLQPRQPFWLTPQQIAELRWESFVCDPPSGGATKTVQRNTVFGPNLDRKS
jgi:hypothetical protein